MWPTSPTPWRSVLSQTGITPPGWTAEALRRRPGNFIDGEGRVLGRHLGIHHYTIGQGRGLGVSGPHRYFVSSLDPEHNTVTLSDGSDLMADRVLCSRPNWIAMDALDGPMEVTVRLRHSRTEAPGRHPPPGAGRRGRSAGYARPGPYPRAACGLLSGRRGHRQRLDRTKPFPVTPFTLSSPGKSQIFRAIFIFLIITHICYN